MDIQERLKRLRERQSQLSAQELLKAAVEEFGDKIALASSFSVEDQVVLDMLTRITGKPGVFTLDTGRLPQETYDLIEQTRKRYDISIEMLFPDTEQVERMLSEKGPNLFYDSIDNRKLCCKVRKIEPLRRRLTTLEGWICGLRSEQSATRTGLERIEADSVFGLIKISPIADWTTKQVWEYVKDNDVPYNKLHDAGYPSIGCACCTRALKPGEDIRAGRWWWESPEHKECGLHLKPQDNKEHK
jgi:phosphoadenosine phosphosulfate reductase